MYQFYLICFLLIALYLMCLAFLCKCCTNNNDPADYRCPFSSVLLFLLFGLICFSSYVTICSNDPDCVFRHQLAGTAHILHDNHKSSHSNNTMNPIKSLTNWMEEQNAKLKENIKLSLIHDIKNARMKYDVCVTHAKKVNYGGRHCEEELEAAIRECKYRKDSYNYGRDFKIELDKELNCD